MTSQSYKVRAWVVWLLASSFFFAEYFARVAPGVMVPDLMRDFKVGAFQLGSLSAYFYYAYVGMQLPVGALVDRFGPRRLLAFMAALCGASCLLFSYSHGLFAAEVGRFFMGFSAAFAFVGALKLASVWFPVNRFGFFAGATQAVGMWGAALGEGPVALLVQHAGWRHTMLLIGVILLLIALAIICVVRDRPPVMLETSQGRRVRSEFGLLDGLWCVLRNKQSWVNGIVAGFLYAPTVAFAELWGPAYLHGVYHVSGVMAASAISVIFIGWGVGSPIMGWVSDHLCSRKTVLLMSILLSALFLTLALYLPHQSIVIIFVLLFCYGVCNAGLSVCYAVACEINPQPIAGTSMSFANMASVIVGALFQPVVGWLLEWHWKGLRVGGLPIYSASDYRLAMLALPLCFLVSLVALSVLKESWAQ